MLRRLLAGVILLRDDHDPSAFHPRFRLMDTPSFAALDPSSHSVLRAIHDGYFYSNHNALWAACARRTLPALMRATDMLICGEDLGFVPECVPPVMHVRSPLRPSALLDRAAAAWAARGPFFAIVPSIHALESTPFAGPPARIGRLTLRFFLNCL